MADPVKSDEIEDVLSSIRRLVSEHHPATHSAPSTPVEQPVGADKLVLTPALRVTDPEDPWVPITARSPLLDENEDGQAGDTLADKPRAAINDLPRTDGTDWAKELWGDENSDPVAAIDPQLQSDIWEEGQAEAGDLDADDILVLAEAEASPVEEDAAEFIAPAPELPPAPEASELEGDDYQDDAPLSFIRSTSSLVDYEPEEGNVAAPDETPPIATLDLAEARAAQQAITDVLTDAAEVDLDSDPSSDEANDEGEVAVGEPEPDASDTVIEIAVDSIVVELADDVITDFLAEPEAEDATRTEASGRSPDRLAMVEDLGESPFSFPDDEDSFVDENALREIIVDVVREELQGEMGKRITRNVRKLVRREIRIALAADDLDD